MAWKRDKMELPMDPRAHPSRSEFTGESTVFPLDFIADHARIDPRAFRAIGCRRVSPGAT